MPDEKIAMSVEQALLFRPVDAALHRRPPARACCCFCCWLPLRKAARYAALALIIEAVYQLSIAILRPTWEWDHDAATVIPFALQAAARALSLYVGCRTYAAMRARAGQRAHRATARSSFLWWCSVEALGSAGGRRRAHVAHCRRVCRRRRALKKSRSGRHARTFGWSPGR